jgi:hypothetical protein
VTDLRIGDAEREEAARELGEHFAVGRITAEEHGERLEQVWAARTARDLAPLFVDLPRPATARAWGQPPPPPAPPAPTWGERARASVPRMPFLFKLLVAIVLFATLVSHLPLLVVLLLIWLICLRRVTARRRFHSRWR